MVTLLVWTAIDNGQSVNIYKKTTSSILVVNKDGEPFITVAMNSFKADGLIYHPNPITGSVIGRIVKHLPSTNISVVKLNSGLRYTNYTFGLEINPDGIKTSSISPGYPPHLQRYNILSMDNPYSGYAEGTVLAPGLKATGEGETDYVYYT
jgi:hypothetical protein